MIHFRFKRLTTTELNQFAPGAGELVLDIEAKKLYVGDGSLLGGHLVGMGEEAVNALIANAFDVLSIDTIAGLTQALAGKADADDLAAIESGLDALATTEALEALEMDVASKMTVAQLATRVDALADQTLLASVATKVATKISTSALTTSLTGKADKSALAALDIEVDNKQGTDALNTAVAKKADQSALNTLKTTTATKAKTVDVNGLKTVVDTKMASATLTTELNKKVDKTALFTNGIINKSVLPSSVDDVLEFATLAAFPTTGEKGKIYIADNTALVYRWSGSAYIRLQQPIAQIIASSEQTKALADRQVYISPLRLSETIATVGFTKDAEGKYQLDEGTIKPKVADNIVLMSDFETLEDQSNFGNTYVLEGTAGLSTVQKKAGTKSLFFGTNGRAKLAKLDSLKTIGTGDFTVEFDHFLTTTDSAYKEIFSLNKDTSVGVTLCYGDNGFSGRLLFGNKTVGATDWYAVAQTKSQAVNRWINYRIVRKSGRLYLLVDGVRVNFRNNLNNGPSVNDFADTSNHSLDVNFALGGAGTGYMDNLKITKAALY